MSFHEALAPAGGGTRLRTGGLAVQRQCACGNHAGGGECEACTRKRVLQRKDRGAQDPAVRAVSAGARAAGGAAADLSGVALRGPAAAPALHTGMRIQRQPLGETAAPPVAVPAAPEAAPAPTPAAAPGTTPEAAPASTAPGAASALIAEDDAAELQTGQMRKSEFLNRLQGAVCAQADSALAATGRSSAGCPYLAGWFGHYRGQSGAHVEAALRRYAPEAQNARSAAEYVPMVAARVRQGVERWAETGEVTGVPEGMPLTAPAASGQAGATGGAGAGGSAVGGLLFKAKEGGARAADDPAAVQQSLGAGQPLESGVRGRMEQAFGQSFAHVRTHTGSTARRVSAEQNARAFAVGRDIAFGAGEYRPGTPVGDALIAHELAHVVQQGGGSESAQARSATGTSYDSLEADADRSAMSAVAALWQGTRGAIRDIADSAAPRLRTGLRLGRCSVQSGGSISASAFQFEQVTGAGSPDERSFPWYAACVNITLSHLSTTPRMNLCQFEVGFPGIHMWGRTSTGEAQALAAEAFNECVPALLRRRSASCGEIARCVQRNMRRRIPGVRVNNPCLTRMLTPTDWPTRH